MRLIDPPGGLPWALLSLCGSSLLLNAILAARIFTAEAPEPVEIPCPEPVAEVVPDTEAADDAAIAELAVPPAPPEPPPLPENTHVVNGQVANNLAYTFQQITPDAHANVVSAVYARLFFWDLDVRRDLQKGDDVSVVYEWDGELAHIPVASYTSRKLGKTLHAYRFQASSDAYPSYWNEEGVEVPYRLKDSPLADYEQVTSLLKDRPRHRGMDFKTPVGTDLLSPRNGKVTRVNWNVANNGSCIEVRYRDGTIAKFLHLSEVTVKAGQSVSAGSVIGKTGNSGRSTAPHLHYELEKSGKVVDPVTYHGVYRRTLPDGDQTAFSQERSHLAALLEQPRG